MTRNANSKTQLRAEMTVIWYYLFLEEDSMMTSTVRSEHFVASSLLGDVWQQAVDLTVANQKVDLMALMLSRPDEYKAISDLMMPRLRSMIEKAEKLMRDGAAVHHAMVSVKNWLQWAEEDEDATPEDLHAAFGEVAARFQVGENIEAVRFGAMTKLVMSRFVEEGVDRGVPIPLIADKVRHWKYKKLYLVGGLTSNHKTTFGLQSVLHAAKKGYPTLMWTLEDDDAEVTERIVVSQSDCMTLDHFERGKQPGDVDVLNDLIRLEKVNEKLPIYQLDKLMTLSKTIAQITRSVYKHGIKFVVIDFMQLIARDDPRTPDTQHQTECAQGLANLAKRLDIVIVCIVQLTQEATKRAADGDAPRLGDVRGGSAIAQAAYGAFMCHRPAPDKTKPSPPMNESSPPEEMQRLEIWIRKCKRANLCGVPCFVDAPHDRIIREPVREPTQPPKFYSISD